MPARMAPIMMRMMPARKRIASRRCRCSFSSSLSSFKRLPTARRCVMKTVEKNVAASQPQTALPNVALTPLISAKIQAAHLERLAVVYVRQSSPKQVPEESPAHQAKPEWAWLKRDASRRHRALDRRFGMRLWALHAAFLPSKQHGAVLLQSPPSRSNRTTVLRLGHPPA